MNFFVCTWKGGGAIPKYLGRSAASAVQESVNGSVADPDAGSMPFWPLDPGSEMGKKITIRELRNTGNFSKYRRYLCVDMYRYGMFWQSFENFRAFFSSKSRITKRDLREIRIFNSILDNQTIRVISQNYINLHVITLASGISAFREIVVGQFRDHPRG